jgi:hypothetical protein
MSKKEAAEAFHRGVTAAVLQQEVELIAMLINGTPQQIKLPANVGENSSKFAAVSGTVLSCSTRRVSFRKTYHTNTGWFQN